MQSATALAYAPGADAIPRALRSHTSAFPLSPAGRQLLAVSGHIVERYLVTFRAPAVHLAPLVPAPLTLDALQGHGFLSVCALEVRGMGIHGTPSFLRFTNREFLYRIGVRYGDEPTFLTLRSDVSAPALAFLGRRFSHYRPRLARLDLTRSNDGFRLSCLSRDGAGDALLDIAAGDAAAPPPHSLFAEAGAAAQFLLVMRISADSRPDGRVQTQLIEHDPWQARFADVRTMRFEFLERLAAALDTRLTYDHTLVMRDLRQLWKATRCR